MTPNGQPFPPHSNTSGAPPWSVGEALAGLFIGFIVGPTLSLSLLNALAPGAFNLLPQGRILLTLTLPILFWIGILRWFFRKYGPHNMLVSLGILPVRPLILYLMFSAAGVTFMLALGTFISFLIQTFHWSVQMPQSMFPKDVVSFIAFFAVASAPLLEESGFRGLLQPALGKHLPTATAISLTALVFTLFHALYYQNPLAMAYVFLFGLVLGCLRRFSRSLIPGIVVHLINNLAAALLIH